MTKRSKNGAKSNGSDGARPKFGFVNYDLTVQDKEWLSSADVEAEFPAQLIDQLVLEGYKFSLSYDERNSCCIASLTDRQPGSAFDNQCLTGRGATPDDARVSLFYRHFHVAQGDWGVFGSLSSTSDEIYG